MASHLTFEQRQRARELRREALRLADIARAVGCSLRTARRVARGAGRREARHVLWSPGPRRSSLAEREEISRDISAGDTLRSIARRLGRAPSTVSCELKSNGGRARYRGTCAHHGAYVRARRPKTPKLVAGTLAATVETWLEQWWSPQAISGRLHLKHPDDRTMWVSHETIYQSEKVGEALRKAASSLPCELMRSITWDQGKELAGHVSFTVDTGVQVYFCDPHSPWQRGSNENTNGLLRQYMPKGTDLSVYDAGDLARVAASLDNRPRQTLGYLKPSEKFTELESVWP